MNVVRGNLVLVLSIQFKRYIMQHPEKRFIVQSIRLQPFSSYLVAVFS
jgi:hypothetical protein